MKVLHINTYDTGGAARACIRLHLGLLEEGVDSKILLLHQTNNKIKKAHKYAPPPPNGFVKFKKKAERILRELNLDFSLSNYKLKLLKERPEGFDFFSFNDTPFNLAAHPLVQEADIVNLHWTSEFLDYATFFNNNSKRIVWTLHDMNPFTGGCHYSEGCTGFESSCNVCPQLKASKAVSYSARILGAKDRAIRQIDNLTLVALSRWLLLQSQRSKMFSGFTHCLIPNGVDANIFKPLDKEYSRAVLGLSLSSKIALFVADSLTRHRKGYSLLLKTLERIGNKEDIVLCAVGESSGRVAQNLIEVGAISDDRLMSIAYSAADVFVIPSIEDNLPNTVLESLMCGTPVVGFATGGISDMVINEKNGYLCEAVTPESLEFTIIKFFQNQEKFCREDIRSHALLKYDVLIQAKRYKELYQKLLYPTQVHDTPKDQQA